MPELTLLDDGTLDTVFLCSECGEELRYSDVERDSDGSISDDTLRQYAEEHADECENANEA